MIFVLLLDVHGKEMLNKATWNNISQMEKYVLQYLTITKAFNLISEKVTLILLLS